MLNPATYPVKPESVDMIQTHISYLFLAGEYVYKVKKPVNFGFLDYSTLEKRKFYCDQEIRLNSRLSPEIYLGVSQITSEKGILSLDGKGWVEEYAVRMKRLPQDKMMDRMILDKRVNKSSIREIAAKLVIFHQHADINDEICKFGDIGIISKNIDENFIQTEKYIGISLSNGEYNFIKDFSLRFIEDNMALFKKRINQKRIMDCHGDLRAEHICLTERIYIFDCIEFNDRFRYGDVASEVAFLAMDLDFFGEDDLSRYFVDSYRELSGDKDIMKLINFYKCYRAYVRGKVESFKLDDPNVTSEEKEMSLNLATRHFKLAYAYAQL
ncbi:MAG: gluconokinase [Nitrospinae bacterium]|nr:gluconokinase [Nitrospinota bacterium]